MAEDGQIKHLGYVGRSDFEFRCVIDPGNCARKFSHLIYLSLRFGFFFIWGVLSLWLYGLTFIDWCVFVAFPYAVLV